MPTGKMLYRSKGDTKRGKLRLDFKVALTGAADPANTVITVTGEAGYVTSVTRTAAGIFRATLTHKYKSLISANVWGGDDTSIDLVPHFEGEDVDGATPYVDFKLQAAATDTDIANGATFTVFVMLCLEDAN